MLRAVDEALKVLPGNVDLVRARSVALIWLGRGDEAARQLETLPQASGATVQDEFVRGVIDLQRGDSENARRRFQAVVDRGPVTLAHIDAGRAYSQVGRMKEAAAHLERAFVADAACPAYIATSAPFTRRREDPAFPAKGDDKSIRELAWLSTCNRVELYALVGDGGAPRRGRDPGRRLWVGFRRRREPHV